MSVAFDLFIGVDWSGAKGPKLPGLQVARCEAQGRVELVANPAGGAWSRMAFAAWLANQLDDARNVVCGIDFSFCFPWTDQGAYFPGISGDPEDPAVFWDLVEELCAGDDEFFGGALAETAPFDAQFHRRGLRGKRYERRLRETETRTLEQGLGAPESAFNLVGARQVGKSSLAGMRFLRAMKKRPGVAVWPFDDPANAALVFVETFPTAFVRMAGEGAGKVRDRERLDRVLSYFRAGCVVERAVAPNDDEADALITAAALRHLASQAQFWHPPGMSDIVRRTEGWTFGVL